MSNVRWKMENVIPMKIVDFIHLTFDLSLVLFSNIDFDVID
jgi:hypothetical protein